MRLVTELRLVRRLGLWCAVAGALLGLAALLLFETHAAAARALGLLCGLLIPFGAGFHFMVGGGPPMTDEVAEVLDAIEGHHRSSDDKSRLGRPPESGH